MTNDLKEIQQLLRRKNRKINNNFLLFLIPAGCIFLRTIVIQNKNFNPYLDILGGIILFIGMIIYFKSKTWLEARIKKINQETIGVSKADGALLKHLRSKALLLGLE